MSSVLAIEQRMEYFLAISYPDLIYIISTSIKKAT